LLDAGANILSFFIYPKQFIKKIYYYICQTKFTTMNLIIDVGNTRIKSAVFEDNTILFQTFFDKNELVTSIKNILNKYKEIVNLVVSSVGNIEKSDFEVFSNQLKIFFLSRECNFPFKNNYASPNTLGLDRMVLASGSVLQFPNQNRLVIDAGTCVTYDFIDKNNIYHGGAITPGIRLRYEVMNKHTAKLPLLTLEEPENLIGNSTIQSLHSGVINGLTFEIDGFINDLKSKNEKFIIILTGGDAIFLANRLKNTIFANSNFLLESLNKLFLYQTKND
jgi:type III pantothenate kinase